MTSVTYRKRVGRQRRRPVSQAGGDSERDGTMTQKRQAFNAHRWFNRLAGIVIVGRVECGEQVRCSEGRGERDTIRAVVSAGTGRGRECHGAELRGFAVSVRIHDLPEQHTSCVVCSM